MQEVGKHLIIELEGCKSGLLNDLLFVRDSLRQAAIDCGATVIDFAMHQFEPQGVTGVVVLSESHISIHTWPETGYASADVYTCGTKANPHIAADILRNRLQASHMHLTEVKRGMRQHAGKWKNI